MVFKTVKDGLLVSSNCFVVNVNNLDQLLQSNVSYIVFFIRQESAQNIDAQHAQTLRRFNHHNSSNALS